MFRSGFDFNLFTAKGGKVQAYASGDTIFQAGDEGQHMYVLCKGQVEIRTWDKPLAILHPPEMFGEMSLVDHSPRSATAVAKTDAELAVVDQDMFVAMIRETPDFALSLLRMMSERIRELNELT